MSKIGKKPIILPDWVSVSQDNGLITVKGSKGTLTYQCYPTVTMATEGNHVTFSVASNDDFKFWWLVRALVNNMVTGVSTGYTIKLHVIWVGFNVKQQGQELVMNLGYSHPVNYTLPASVTATIDKDPKWFDIITLQSIDKQLIGQVASQIRALRAPEPYKGKGVRYSDETIKLKAGKTAKK
jgi:large subunit ribosomal protein L6